MSHVLKSLFAIGSFSLLLSLAALAQTPETSGAHSSIGLRAGYGLPLGDWAKSRVVPTIEQFTGNVAFEGDITLRLEAKWGLVLEAGYMPLNGRKWESYALSKGDVVSVSGSIAEVSIALRPYLSTSPPNLVALELGVVGLFASGSELVNHEQYEYDFFSTFRFGVQAALEYDRIMWDKVALTLRAGAVVAPAGMNYADGESRTIVYMPMTFGVRFLL